MNIDSNINQSDTELIEDESEKSIRCFTCLYNGAITCFDIAQKFQLSGPSKSLPVGSNYVVCELNIIVLFPVELSIFGNLVNDDKSIKEKRSTRRRDRINRDLKGV